MAFSKAELDRLPELRGEVRDTFKDAPPRRPDEEKEIAAGYARRFPFRVPAAA